MSKMNCELIKDLLPLYADKVCSEESTKAVGEHIAGCAECRRELEKLGTSLKLPVVNDANAIKGIRNRIRIEKAVIACVIAVIVLLGAFVGVNFLLNTDCSMDYNKYNIAENVKIIEDDNGELWLELSGSAIESFTFPTIRDANGKLFYYDKNFDPNSKEAFGFTLKHRRVLEFADKDFNDCSYRKSLGNKDELEYDEFFYYDDKNNVQYTLWRRDNNE